MSDTYDRDPDDIEDDIVDDQTDDAGENADSPEDEDDDLEIGFDGEAPPTDTDLVKHLRQVIKDKDAQLARGASRPEIIDPGPKPTLEGSDYDEEKFESALDAWKDKDRAAKAQREAEKPPETVDWVAEGKRFEEAKNALKAQAKDFDVIEAVVSASLSPAQIGALVQGSENPAKVVYALGKSPGKLAEVSAITNPFKFAAAVSRLEGKITMKSRRTPVDVDEPVRGGARLAPAKGALEKQLETAEAEFNKRGGGDRSKVIALQKKIKERDAKKA